MTPFDYVVLGILLASMAIGAWRGVIGEIIALAAWVLAFCRQVVGRRVRPPTADRHCRPGGAPRRGWVLVFVIVLLMALVRLAIPGCSGRSAGLSTGRWAWCSAQRAAG
jgi:membrane protein required for colicin V production